MSWLLHFSRIFLLIILLALSSCGYAQSPNQPDFKPIRPDAPATPPAAASGLPAKPTSVISDQVGLSDFTHATRRFSISYPANWSYFEQPNGVVFIDPTDQGGYSVFFTDVGQKYSEQELNQYLVTFVAKNFAQKDSQLTPLSQETTSNGTITAQFSSIDPKLGQAISEIRVLQKENIVFVIFISTTQGQWQLSQAQFQRLADTLRVLDTSPSVTTPSPTGEPPEWTLIGPKNNSFGFFYPNNWQIERQDETSVAVSMPDTDFLFEVTFSKRDTSGDIAEAAKQAAEQYVKKLGKDHQDVQSLPPQKFQLDQIQDGATIDFLYTGADGKSRAGSIITVANQNNLYQVVFSSPADLYQGALQWFNPMYKSFTILPADQMTPDQK